jgi:hypothetical protein
MAAHDPDTQLDFSLDTWDHGRGCESLPSFPQPLPTPKGVFYKVMQTQQLGLESTDVKEGCESEKKDGNPAFRKLYNKIIGIRAHL